MDFSFEFSTNIRFCTYLYNRDNKISTISVQLKFSDRDTWKAQKLNINNIINMM